jgi:FAD/FMN-containing dehydrogenase
MVPLGLIVPVAGLMIIDDKVRTVRFVNPERVPTVAVIFPDPPATPVAKPALEPVLWIVAVAVDDEDQVAELVRFCVELSL